MYSNAIWVPFRKSLHMIMLASANVAGCYRSHAGAPPGGNSSCQCIFSPFLSTCSIRNNCNDKSEPLKTKLKGPVHHNTAARAALLSWANGQTDSE